MIVIRRSRPVPVPLPDRALTAVADRAGATARAAQDLRSAVSAVLGDVADANGWSAGHAWRPAAGGWVSMRLWHPDDGIALGGLRGVLYDAEPGPVTGHLGDALRRQGPRWTGDLAALPDPVRTAAAAAGVVAAIGCPVYVDGTPVALLEWYLSHDRRPAPDAVSVLAHLAAVLAEVAARPPVHGIPEQGTMRTGLALLGG